MKLSEEQQVKRDKLLKWVALILCMILPVTVVGVLAVPSAELFADIIFHVTWCGLYGCILLYRQKVHIILKVVMIVINALAFCIPAMAAMMGGLGGLGIILLKTVIPIVPWITLLG